MEVKKSLIDFVATIVTKWVSLLCFLADLIQKKLDKSFILKKKKTANRPETDVRVHVGLCYTDGGATLRLLVGEGEGHISDSILGGGAQDTFSY